MSAHFRDLSRTPDYGLRRTKRSYNLDSARPVGPRIFRWRGLLRRGQPGRWTWVWLAALALAALVLLAIGLVTLAGGSA